MTHDQCAGLPVVHFTREQLEAMASKPSGDKQAYAEQVERDLVGLIAAIGGNKEVAMQCARRLVERVK